GPSCGYLSSTSWRTTGVTLSAGNMPLSSSSVMSVNGEMLASVVNTSAAPTSPRASDEAVGTPESSGTKVLNLMPYVDSNPGMHKGRCGHSAGPPSVRSAATLARSVMVCTFNRVAVSSVTAMALRSSAGAESSTATSLDFMRSTS